MATDAWDRIDNSYRSYLENAGISAEEFNGETPKGKTDLFNNFQSCKQQQQQQQINASEALEGKSPNKGEGVGDKLTAVLIEQLWQSVLRIKNSETDEIATALVFDVHADNDGPFLLLLANKRFRFKNDELVQLFYCNDDEEYYLVESFTRDTVRVFEDGGTLDFMIYSVPLKEAEWIFPEPGKAIRRTEVTAENPRKTPKRAAAQQSVRMKKAPIICKTPRYTYQGVQHSMSVRVFGFPQAAHGRWEANTTVTSIGRETFHIQSLSAPGLSGGAVVATSMGNVVGFMGGAWDALEEGKEQRFASYAIPVHKLPVRPSSKQSSGL